MTSLTFRKELPLQAGRIWEKCVSGLWGGLELLHKHTIPVLTVLFGLCVLVLYVHFSQLRGQVVIAMALSRAEIYTRALGEMRTWYTSEVVERLHDTGKTASAKYPAHNGEIPLPAALTRTLGNRLVSGRPGEHVRLLSAFPFSSGADPRGLTDAFQQEAWDFLNEYPARPFYRFEQIDGRETLRFATADRMKENCVECHNAHPDSPKRDWQVGQVGGMLEVVYPIDSFETVTGMSWRESYGLLGMLVMLWLGGFGLVVVKVRRASGELEDRVRHRTADLREANRQLELEIYERQLAEDTLRHARDTLEKRVQERTTKLAGSNAELIREVAERKRAEDDVRKLNSELVQRSAQLESSNKELESFSYSVSHDLRAPLRGIDGFSQAMLEDYDDKLDESGKSYLRRVRTASQRMSKLIDAMLDLARLTRCADGQRARAAGERQLRSAYVDGSGRARRDGRPHDARTPTHGVRVPDLRRRRRGLQADAGPTARGRVHRGQTPHAGGRGTAGAAPRTQGPEKGPPGSIENGGDASACSLPGLRPRRGYNGSGARRARLARSGASRRPKRRTTP